jgi:hypothetical protein
MLKDGKFIKEDPPKIGSHYIPTKSMPFNREELFVQSVLLGINDNQQSFLSKFFGFVLRV